MTQNCPVTRHAYFNHASQRKSWGMATKKWLPPTTDHQPPINVVRPFCNARSKSNICLGKYTDLCRTLRRTRWWAPPVASTNTLSHIQPIVTLSRKSLNSASLLAFVDMFIYIPYATIVIECSTAQEARRLWLWGGEQYMRSLKRRKGCQGESWKSSVQEKSPLWTRASREVELCRRGSHQ